MGTSYVQDLILDNQEMIIDLLINKNCKNYFFDFIKNQKLNIIF